MMEALSEVHRKPRAVCSSASVADDEAMFEQILVPSLATTGAVCNFFSSASEIAETLAEVAKMKMMEKKVRELMVSDKERFKEFHDAYMKWLKCVKMSRHRKVHGIKFGHSYELGPGSGFASVAADLSRLALNTTASPDSGFQEGFGFAIAAIGMAFDIHTIVSNSKTAKNSEVCSGFRKIAAEIGNGLWEIFQTADMDFKK